MGYDNYWVNLIETDELIDQLFRLYKPLLSKKWNTEYELENDILVIKNNFFNKNKNYLKYQNLIVIKFIIGMSGSYHSNDYDYVLKKLTVERIF
jgi:hypothetical protein